MLGFVKDEQVIPWINSTEKIVYVSKKVIYCIFIPFKDKIIKLKKLPLLISYNVTL
jgi:hypothetical protein